MTYDTSKRVIWASIPSHDVLSSGNITLPGTEDECRDYQGEYRQFFSFAEKLKHSNWYQDYILNTTTGLASSDRINAIICCLGNHSLDFDGDWVQGESRSDITNATSFNPDSHTLMRLEFLDAMHFHWFSTAEGEYMKVDSEGNWSTVELSQSPTIFEILDASSLGWEGTVPDNSYLIKTDLTGNYYLTYEDATYKITNSPTIEVGGLQKYRSICAFVTTVLSKGLRKVESASDILTWNTIHTGWQIIGDGFNLNEVVKSQSEGIASLIRVSPKILSNVALDAIIMACEFREISSDLFETETSFYPSQAGQISENYQTQVEVPTGIKVTPTNLISENAQPLPCEISIRFGDLITYIRLGNPEIVTKEKGEDISDNVKFVFEEFKPDPYSKQLENFKVENFIKVNSETGEIQIEDLSSQIPYFNEETKIFDDQGEKSILKVDKAVGTASISKRTSPTVPSIMSMLRSIKIPEWIINNAMATIGGWYIGTASEAKTYNELLAEISRNNANMLVQVAAYWALRALIEEQWAELKKSYKIHSTFSDDERDTVIVSNSYNASGGNSVVITDGDDSYEATVVPIERRDAKGKVTYILGADGLWYAKRSVIELKKETKIKLLYKTSDNRVYENVVRTKYITPDPLKVDPLFATYITQYKNVVRNILKLAKYNVESCCGELNDGVYKDDILKIQLVPKIIQDWVNTRPKGEEAKSSKYKFCLEPDTEWGIYVMRDKGFYMSCHSALEHIYNREVEYSALPKWKDITYKTHNKFPELQRLTWRITDRIKGSTPVTLEKSSIFTNEFLNSKFACDYLDRLLRVIKDLERCMRDIPAEVIDIGTIIAEPTGAVITTPTGPGTVVTNLLQILKTTARVMRNLKNIKADLQNIIKDLKSMGLPESWFQPIDKMLEYISVVIN